VCTCATGVHPISAAFTEHNSGDKPDCRDTWLLGCFCVCLCLKTFSLCSFGRVQN
jgi:hypothetical protein